MLPNIKNNFTKLFFITESNIQILFSLCEFILLLKFDLRKPKRSRRHKIVQEKWYMVQPSYNMLKVRQKKVRLYQQDMSNWHDAAACNPFLTWLLLSKSALSVTCKIRFNPKIH